MKRKISEPIHAWVIWLLSALFMFYKYALEVSPSVMTSTLMRAFQINGTQLGNLAACYFYSYLLFQIPAGLFLDKYGPRKVTTLAIGLCAVGSILFARSETFFMAAIGRFITGAGAAFAAVNCLKLIANWFPYKQFAFMAGLMMTMAMLGAVGGQAPLAAFIERLDWRRAMEITGFAGVILAIFFWFIVRDKAPSHKINKHMAPADVKFLDTLKKIFRNRESWFLSLYSGFAFAPVMVFGGLWGVSFISEAYDLTHNMAAQTLSLIFIGFAVGAPVFGWFSDYLGNRRKVMFWGTFLSLLFITAIIYLPAISHFLLILLLFFFGVAISSFLLCFTMIREIHPPIFAATAIGFMNAFDALFGAFSDPLTGKFLDIGWTGVMRDGARIFSVDAYKAAFLTLPIYLIISLVLLFWIKETYCKPVSPNSLP
ncbi:MAG TPA: MFS transporter [Chlamydiales bacterium]|nr:MFS transporter [Chlamydiales bacterium]